MGDRSESADGNRLMNYTIAPLSEHTGAEVRGIDLTEPINEVVQVQLNRAFVDSSVLVFRDQHLTPQQLLKAVSLFGEPFPQHNSRFALPECPLVHYISNQDFYPDGRRYIPGEGYHTDHSNAARPPKATVLHAVSLPDLGGDTQYADMRLAYDELPQETKRRLADLLEHVTQPQYQYRHQWRPGDLVMWDNRSLLHKANGDYDMGQLRYLYRIMLQGDVPV